jgi:hypothetical protein
MMAKVENSTPVLVVGHIQNTDTLKIWRGDTSL